MRQEEPRASGLSDNPTLRNMLRSEEMTLVQLIDANDAARAVITELGEASVLHFKDLNEELPRHKRAFSSEMKRADEMTRRINFLLAQVQAAGLAIDPAPDMSAGSSSSRPLLPPLEHVDALLRQAQAERLEGRTQESQVARAHNALKEHLHVLALGATLFDSGSGESGLPALPARVTRSSHDGDAGSGLSASLLSHAFPTGAGGVGSGEGAGGEGHMLHVLAGTVNRALVPALTRAIHRITRGNSVVHEAPIDEPLLGFSQVSACVRACGRAGVRACVRACLISAWPMPASRADVNNSPLWSLPHPRPAPPFPSVCPPPSPRAAQDANSREPVPMAKNFVLILYSGAILHGKVTKICTHFGVSLYAYPDGKAQRQALHARVEVQLMEMRELVRHTEGSRLASLRGLKRVLGTWRLVIDREKATLHTLNMISLDPSRKVFIAEGWVPTNEMPMLYACLARAAVKSGTDTTPIVNVLEMGQATPPSFIRTTSFTAGFQALVDTYGVPRYGEVNPGAFAVILFPFLFAIMFGDVGHGALLTMLAVFFIANEEKMLKMKLDDIVGMAFGGRYVLLLNGVFAIYVGFLYNEAFSVPLGLYPSTWVVDESAPEGSSAEWDGTVYPFGVDPMWHKAANKMSFFNSYKMKISIIFGVCQMALGIFLSLLNCRHFKDKRSIYYGFVPEMTFFLGIFGYLVIMILRKWSIDWVGEKKRPPSLLNTLISMFMSPGVYTEEDRLYVGQEYVQLLLMLIAVIAVPFLLLPKPLLHYWDMQAAAKAKAEARADQPLEAAAEAGGTAAAAEAEAEEDGEEEEEDEGMGDVVVHQAIHTIEFVLGSISNTASYLRLWALSLAHSQLSELFWDKVMREQAWGMAISLPTPLNGIMLMLLFSMWFLLNIGVIMVMENLSSFLHALRLQWVEFQNKFYKGDGYKFVPFSYALVGVDNDD